MTKKYANTGRRSIRTREMSAATIFTAIDRIESTKIEGMQTTKKAIITMQLTWRIRGGGVNHNGTPRGIGAEAGDVGGEKVEEGRVSLHRYRSIRLHDVKTAQKGHESTGSRNQKVLSTPSQEDRQSQVLAGKRERIMKGNLDTLHLWQVRKWL